MQYQSTKVPSKYQIFVLRENFSPPPLDLFYIFYLILAFAMKLMMDSVANAERMYGKIQETTSEDRDSQGV